MTLAFVPAVGESLLRSCCPQSEISAAERAHGMRLVLLDGLTSQTMETLASGVVLTGFAASLGASNFTLGFLAALPSLAQIAQMPAVLLLERLRMRRLIAVAAAVIGRGSLVALGAGAFLPPERTLELLVIVAIIHAAFGAVVGCSWNSWMRDLLPSAQVNGFLARRSTYTSLWGAILTLAVALIIGTAGTAWPHQSIALLCSLATLGGLSGLSGAYLLWRTPEPAMPSARRDRSFGELLCEPVKVPNFRRLIVFLAVWGLAVNAAAPFFAVYMLKSLDLSFPVVTAFVMLGQLAAMASMRMWANLADRTQCKLALRQAGRLFILALVGWILIGNPAMKPWLLPALCVVQVLTGIATAGASLAAASIALKLSPPQQATSYLAVNSIISALAGGLAPLLGGGCVDYLASSQLSFSIRWTSTSTDLSFPALQLQHWQFFFGLAIVASTIALTTLRAVRERRNVFC